MSQQILYTDTTNAVTANPLQDLEFFKLNSTTDLTLDSTIHIPQFEKATSATQVFSEGSTLNPDLLDGINLPATILHQASLSWVVAIFILITLTYYLFVIYRYWSYLPTMFRVAPSLNKTLIVYDVQNNEQVGFGIHSTILLALGISTTVVEFLQEPINSQPIILIIIIASVFTIFLYKYIVLNLCRLFSDDRNGMQSINIINSHTTSLTAIILTPIAVATVTNLPQSKTLIGVALVLWIFYIVRLLGIFNKSGFGKLQWILYLCAVEILPVSFLIALAVRY